MNQKELRELIEFLVEKDIAEFELERGDLKVRVKRALEPAAHIANSTAPQAAAPQVLAPLGAPHPHITAPTSPASQEPAGTGAKAGAEPEEDLYIVKSPIVGTFYEAPSPGSPPFVKVGDMVEAGQALCIIEAMKLMNEIESDVSGEIARRFVSNGQPVEYGQQLFAVRQRK